MLVNARLSYILVDGLHYSFGGQLVFSITSPFLTDQEIHLATETEQDQTKLPLLQ